MRWYLLSIAVTSATLAVLQVLHVLIRHRFFYHGLPEARIQRLGDTACIKLFSPVKIGCQAGQSLNLYMPGLGFRSCFESHPFVVVSARHEPRGSTLELMIEPRRGWTKRVFQEAHTANTKTEIPCVAFFSVLESGDISARRSVLRRYRDRLIDTRNGNAALPGLSLLSCLQFWDWLTWKIRPRASSRFINYYPRYLNDPKSLGYSNYCRVEVMLHHPFTDWPDLLSVENKTYGSHIDAFQACGRLHAHPPDFYDDPEGEGSDSDSDSGDEYSQEAENEHPLADFEAFARRRPRADLATHGDMLDGLGSRQIDRSYDWSTHIGRYHDLCPDVWEQIKAENPIELLVDVNSSPEPLNLEQKRLYDLSSLTTPTRSA